MRLNEGKAAFPEANNLSGVTVLNLDSVIKGEDG